MGALTIIIAHRFPEHRKAYRGLHLRARPRRTAQAGRHDELAEATASTPAWQMRRARAGDGSQRPRCVSAPWFMVGAKRNR
ncbi:MAG: hypothetical protein R3A10_00660 [Caldilineaceae bacterium]